MERVGHAEFLMEYVCYIFWYYLALVFPFYNKDAVCAFLHACGCKIILRKYTINVAVVLTER